MRLLTILFLSVFFSLNGVAETLKIEIKTVTINGDYAEIKETLEMAIANQGMVISKVFKISDMLQRTAQAVGATKQIYRQGESLSFCSAILSREMMKFNPDYISFCPFKISIYHLPDTANSIHLTYQTIHSSDNRTQQLVFYKINKLLAEIVAEVVE
jgi:uncharacterized protein (DUF302 family)